MDVVEIRKGIRVMQSLSGDLGGLIDVALHGKNEGQQHPSGGEIGIETQQGVTGLDRLGILTSQVLGQTESEQKEGGILMETYTFRKDLNGGPVLPHHEKCDPQIQRVVFLLRGGGKGGSKILLSLGMLPER